MDATAKYERWICILDDLYARAEKLKRSPIVTTNHSECHELKFDFEKIAFERLKIRLEKSKISIREYYRLCGLLYSLRKSEARQLLVALKERFQIESDNRYVWINDIL